MVMGDLPMQRFFNIEHFIFTLYSIFSNLKKGTTKHKWMAKLKYGQPHKCWKYFEKITKWLTVKKIILQ